MKKKTTGDKFYAELTDGLITITSHMGENATIEYDLYWEGDTQTGSVDISTGTPVFTPDAQTLSLQASASKNIVTIDPTKTGSSKSDNKEEF